jgi:hypothetical protein
VEGLMNRVRVNTYIRKRKTVKAHSRRKPIIKKKGIIRDPEKRIFRAMSSPPYNQEFGGQLDFDKTGELERFTTTTGNRFDVAPIVDDDFEGAYHIHPGKKLISVLPSHIDLASVAKEKGQQVEVIFNNGISNVIAKTNKAKPLRKLSMPKLLRHFDKKLSLAESKSRTDKELINNFKKTLKEDGFIMNIQTNQEKNITVPLRIKEPRT